MRRFQFSSILLASILLAPWFWSRAAAAQNGGAREPAAQSNERSEVRDTTRKRNDDADEPDIELQAALDRARSYYQSGDYDSCVQAYAQLGEKLDAPPQDIPAPLVEEARVHYAACLFALGDKAGAGSQLRRAIKDNPQMGSPDQVVFPEPFRDYFFKVRAEKLDEIERDMREGLERARRQEAARRQQEAAERERVAELERLASMETMVHRNQRWIAALPFGVGQFQNGDKALGAVFAVTELGLLSATVIAVSRQLSFHSQAGGGKNVYDPPAFNNPIQDAHQVELVAGGLFLVVMTAGIIEAQLSFVEEVPIGMRPRKESSKPPTAGLRIEPQVGFASGGASVGVVGQF